jgi:steroid 5-alpha reductase family enzyme
MTASLFLLTLVCVFASLSILMSGAWLVWRETRNSGWVDTVWTFGLGAIACIGALLPGIASGAFTSRQLLVAALIFIWSLRLGLHIAQRTAGITDDPRYAELLRGWGKDAVRRMFWLMQKQAWVSVPLALSMLLAAWNPVPELRAQDYLAVFILLVGIGGEALADAQLRHFRSNPKYKGRICASGLWSWSRHPNYFFEWFCWLAYPLLAIDLAGNYPWGWAALFGPVCMYWLLVHISGIPPLEEHMLKKRGAKFRAYQARTNAFFPAPPRTS